MPTGNCTSPQQELQPLPDGPSIASWVVPSADWMHRRMAQQADVCLTRPMSVPATSEMNEDGRVPGGASMRTSLAQQSHTPAHIEQQAHGLNEREHLMTTRFRLSST